MNRKKGEIRERDVDIEKLTHLQKKKFEGSEDNRFQNEITELVEKAEKLARDYDIEMKKALKEGKMVENSPYLEIIEIYSHIRKEVLDKGWTDQGVIYTNQIKLYQEKLEKDKELRDFESEKVKKQQEFIESQKSQIKAGLSREDKEKLRKIEDLTKQEQEEKLFEQEIDMIVDGAEKEAREYEMAIKKGQFDKKCPYLGIVEIYKNLRKKVYARGWKDEAELYANQITLYHEKYQKDKRLRELEGQKVEKQKEFEKSLKASTKIKPLGILEVLAFDSKNKETDEILTQALNLIDEAEQLVRSYEVNLKKDILSLKSPYEEVIDMYTKARKVLQKIGMNKEAQKLNNTIGFYESKKFKDDNLRAFELQKAGESKITPVLIPKDDYLLQEMRIEELKKLKESKTKESEEILNKISQAEKIAKDYEIAKKKGILKVDSPYKEIIQIYKNAKIGFEKIGWVEQANQLINSINYYQEKLEEGKRLRVLEFKRDAKQREEIKRIEKETLDSKQAKDELSQARLKALEEKKRSVMKYESKKEQAFNFMDLANKKLKQNNFDKAIKFYKESQQIFDEMNWSEGIKMTKESINAINLKKKRIKLEKEKLAQKKLEKIRIKAQLGHQITKTKDLYDLQQIQRRELSAIQAEKEREKETSDNAYRLLEEGTKLKNDKMFDDSYEKYIMARDLFKKIGWQIEVSRINNDLLIKLNKEKKRTTRLGLIGPRGAEEHKELKLILKEADDKQEELDHIRKEEKIKQREKLIQKERDRAHEIIKNLKYNEGILALRKIIKKIENTTQDKLVKEILKQIEILENASQVPIITKQELDDKEDAGKVRLAYLALDKAQISLSNNFFMKAITELREARYNLKETEIGKSYIPEIEDRINIYMKELDIKQAPKLKVEALKDENDGIRTGIARRREARYNLKETEIGKSYIPEIEDRINIYMKELDINWTPEPKVEAPKDESDDIRTRIAKRREERRKRINDDYEGKIGNKERILNLLKSNALTSKEIANRLNLSEKNTRTYLLRLKKEEKIKTVSKKGRFSIYTLQRPPISNNQYNEIGALEDDLNYLLNLLEMKMTPKDGVKFTPTDIIKIRRIESRIADKIGGNLEAREVIKDLIDFEQSFKEEINEKITKLEEKVEYITSRKVKPIKDEILEAKNGATDLIIEDYLTKPDSVIKFLSDEQTSTSKNLLVCNVCGAIFSYDYLYCSKCGNKLLKNQGSELTEIDKSVAPQETLTSPIIPIITEKRKITPEPTAEEYDYLFKSIVVGDGGVGKTALTLRFSKGFFTEDYKMTIGVDFHVKTITIETFEGPIKCKLQLWDTGGQERFSSIRPMYYRGSLGTILVFDLTNAASFEHLSQWIEEVRSNIKAEIPVLLVGNKSDLTAQRVVSLQEINNFTRDFNLYYMETSAKTGDGVGDCFYILACLMIGQGVPDQLIGNTTVYAPGQIIAASESTEIFQNDFLVPPVPEPAQVNAQRVSAQFEPELEYEAPPVPEPALIPQPIINPEFSKPEPSDIEFKTPDQIMAAESQPSEKEIIIADSGAYRPKTIPFTSNVPIPVPTPKEFQTPITEKPAERSLIQTPFRVTKKEEPSKPQPVYMTFGPISQPQQEVAAEPPFFQAPVSQPDSSESLVDYMPQTIIPKKDLKRLAKERKRQDKEKANIEKEKKTSERREKQGELFEAIKTSKKGKKEKKVIPAGLTSEQASPQVSPSSKPNSLFRTLTQRTEEAHEKSNAPFLPFNATKNVVEEEKSKLRIIPNVADLDNNFTSFTAITSSHLVQEEKPKPKSSDLFACEQCGTILSSDYAFCNKCGNKL